MQALQNLLALNGGNNQDNSQMNGLFSLLGSIAPQSESGKGEKSKNIEAKIKEMMADPNKFMQENKELVDKVKNGNTSLEMDKLLATFGHEENKNTELGTIAEKLKTKIKINQSSDSKELNIMVIGKTGCGQTSFLGMMTEIDNYEDVNDGMIASEFKGETVKIGNTTTLHFIETPGICAGSTDTDLMADRWNSLIEYANKESGIDLILLLIKANQRITSDFFDEFESFRNLFFEKTGQFLDRLVIGFTAIDKLGSDFETQKSKIDRAINNPSLPQLKDLVDKSGKRLIYIDNTSKDNDQRENIFNNIYEFSKDCFDRIEQSIKSSDQSEDHNETFQNEDNLKDQRINNNEQKVGSNKQLFENVERKNENEHDEISPYDNASLVILPKSKLSDETMEDNSYAGQKENNEDNLKDQRINNNERKVGSNEQMFENVKRKDENQHDEISPYDNASLVILPKSKLSDETMVDNSYAGLKENKEDNFEVTIKNKRSNKIFRIFKTPSSLKNLRLKKEMPNSTKKVKSEKVIIEQPTSELCNRNNVDLSFLKRLSRDELIELIHKTAQENQEFKECLMKNAVM